MNHLDLFSGIGGFALAAQLAGIHFENTYYSDIEDYANKVYQKNFPAAIPLGDIRTIDGKALKEKHKGPWIITGGFPCQNISCAGQREGLSGSRSGLWWEYRRLIDELEPQFIIAENVSALCRSGLERVLFSLAEIGYDAEWETISAASVGAPHLRERVWIVAYPNVHRGPACCQLQTINREVGNGNEVNHQTNVDDPWIYWETIKAERALDREPLLYRMDDGLPEGVDETLSRLKCCGNSIVPQVAATIFAKIKPLLNRVKGAGGE